MPRRDGTGPSGQGALTGRQQGTCTETPGFGRRNQASRLGYGGRGRGGFGMGCGPRNRRNSVNSNFTPFNTNDGDITKELLSQQLNDLKEEMSRITKLLADI